jgi:hypothetical protein
VINDKGIRSYGMKTWRKKRSLGRRRRRRKDINIALKETEWEDVDWIQLAQDEGQWWALVIVVLNL